MQDFVRNYSVTENIWVDNKHIGIFVYTTNLDIITIHVLWIKQKYRHTFRQVSKYILEFAKQKGYKNITAKEIFKLSLQNKKWAKEIIDLSAKSVSELCANLKAIFDIDIIILGGSIGMAQGYLELVKKNLKKEPKLFHVKVVKSSLGVKAAKMGVLL